jgi:hypothetical protein
LASEACAYRRSFENSVSKCGPQRGVDYYYKHIHKEAKKEEDFNDSYKPANKDV